MKKLLVTLAAGIAASLANAAAVTWNSGTFAEGFTDHAGAKMSGSAYTMSVTFFSDSAGQTEVTTGSSSFVKPNGSISAKTGDLFSLDTTYYVKAIVSGKDGTQTWQREADIASFTTKALGDPSIDFMTGVGFDTETLKWGAWESSDVPEPTSGMLLLIGMAGLALKRKRA